MVWERMGITPQADEQEPTEETSLGQQHLKTNDQIKHSPKKEHQDRVEYNTSMVRMHQEKVFTKMRPEMPATETIAISRSNWKMGSKQRVKQRKSMSNRQELE